MDFKTGIVVLVVGIMLAGVLGGSMVSAWATNAAKAMSIVDGSTSFTVAVGIDINEGSSCWGNKRYSTSPIPLVDKEYGIVYGNYEYSGYAGYKYNAFGFGGGDEDKYTGVCDGGLHGHAWINGWDMGKTLTCVEY
ncbi:MAG: hypothetical protein BWK75_04420 [Candidatus Altiarchaeales archaeon A3]|nr:MAG: hypothetical protein BWK75_04420 [Candidatus Altiarchaeales archaeon A3]